MWEQEALNQSAQTVTWKTGGKHDQNPIFPSVPRVLIKSIKSTTFGTDLKTFSKYVDDENNTRNKMQE